jgi:hypothetical protein
VPQASRSGSDLPAKPPAAVIAHRPATVVVTGVLAFMYVVPLVGTASLLTAELVAECFAQVCDAEDRLGARGVITIIGALVFYTGGIIRGVPLLLRTGRARPVVAPVAVGVGFSELGWGFLGSAYSFPADPS